MMLECYFLCILVMNEVLICLQSFVTDGVYNELYTIQLTYQQSFVDQRGVETKYNVIRQMATPPIPRLPFSINRELEWMLNVCHCCSL